MRQIIKSLASFCQVYVYKHSYSRNFDTILMKFCIVIRGPKSKVEFVWDKKSDNCFPYFTLILKKNALQPMGTSKRYNLVPVKDNCMLPPIFRVGQWCHLNLPPDSCCHSNHSKVSKFCITANGDFSSV